MKNVIKIIVFIFIFTLFNANSHAALDISAYSAVVIEVKSGRILYEKNADDRKYMASTTKIMTALIAIENGNLNNKVKITREAANVEGSSIYLEAGEEISLRDLLYGLILRSGNDSAKAIACHIGGSEEHFVEMMNARARELGAVNTNFINPHGLHNPNHYTTARDLALIAREAMKNKIFKKIAGTALWVAERGEGKYNYFYNKNKVLNQYKGGNGIKTGYTKIAGRCLAASSERNGMELICVVLDAPDWFNDAYSLMDYIYKEYSMVKIVDNDIPLKTIGVINGKKEFTKVVAKDAVAFPVRQTEKNRFTLEYDIKEKIAAPIVRGNKLGTLKVYLNDEQVNSVDLVSREDIEIKNDSVIKKIKSIFNN